MHTLSPTKCPSHSCTSWHRFGFGWWAAPLLEVECLAQWHLSRKTFSTRFPLGPQSLSRNLTPLTSKLLPPLVSVWLRKSSNQMLRKDVTWNSEWCDLWFHLQCHDQLDKQDEMERSPPAFMSDCEKIHKNLSIVINNNDNFIYVPANLFALFWTFSLLLRQTLTVQ